jgi:hypothetical protein
MRCASLRPWSRQQAELMAMLSCPASLQPQHQDLLAYLLACTQHQPIDKAHQIQESGITSAYHVVRECSQSV